MVLTIATERFEIQAETRYDNARRYWLRISEGNFDGRSLPDVLINQYRKKGFIECQTLDLLKLNQRIEDSHQEVVLMSDKTIQDLLDNIRVEIPSLFRVCESIAMLDMLAGFATLVTSQDATQEYVMPQITDEIAIELGRHPVREQVRMDIVPSEIIKDIRLMLFINRYIRRNLSQTMSMQVNKPGFKL